MSVEKDGYKMETVKTDLNKALSALKQIRRELNVAVDKETALEEKYTDEKKIQEWLHLRVGFLVSAGFELDSSCEILKQEIGQSDWVPVEHTLFEFKEYWPGPKRHRTDIIEAAEVLKGYLDEAQLNNINPAAVAIKRVSARLGIFLDLLSKAYDEDLHKQTPSYKKYAPDEDELNDGPDVSCNDLYKPYEDKPKDLEDVVLALEKARDTYSQIRMLLIFITVLLWLLLLHVSNPDFQFSDIWMNPFNWVRDGWNWIISD